MPDQPASQGSNNPRNNPRQHKKPTRRHPGASVPASVPHSHGVSAPQPQSAAVPPETVPLLLRKEALSNAAA